MRTNRYYSAVMYLLGTFIVLWGEMAHGAEVNTATTPQWVKPLAVPSEIRYPKHQIRNGVYYVFVDVQVRASSGKHPEVYRHHAEHVVNKNGVEDSSQINIKYDPSYQKVVLHTLRVHRNNRLIDKAQTADIKILQQEDEMKNLIYNGDNTLNIILDDIRVGDTIEYSYTRTGSNPVYNGIFGFAHSLNWNVPVGELLLKVVWDKAVPLYHQLLNSTLPVNRVETQYGTEFSIQSKNIEPLTVEKNTPDWFQPWGYVQFNELDQWSKVNDWGLTLYKDAWQANNEIDEIVRQIQSSTEDVKGRVSRALQFVQSEIRYLGIEMGENSHRPSPAFETLQRRYGDCKDKTVLFILMLRKMGIEAYPSLVNTGLLMTLDEYLPSARLFDHVIANVVVDDSSYWLDPTRSYQQGGLDTIHQPDYGYALVLKQGTGALTLMQPKNNSYGVEVNERFVIHDDVTLPVTYTTSTVYRGWNAERQRYSIAEKGEARLQRQYLEYFQHYYPHITATRDIQTLNDDLNNRFTINEYYELPEFWRDDKDRQKHTATFYGSSIDGYLKQPDEPKRKHPLDLSHPYKINQVIEVILPDDNWYFEDEELSENNPFFDFLFRARFDESERKLELSYFYETKKEFIPAEKYPIYFAALDKVNNYLSYGIMQPYGPVSSSDDGHTQTSMERFIDGLTISKVLAAYFALYLLVLLLWRLEQWRKPFSGSMEYFPVTLPKFLFMCVFSVGIYPVYWFYRNFRYIKENNNQNMMPAARGFFYTLWYYPLWRYLKLDSESRSGNFSLFSKPLAIVAAVLFFAMSFSGTGDQFWFLGLLLSAALCAPLANYILHVNQNATSAIDHNSRWRFRHVLLFLLSSPLLFFSTAQETGLLPNPEVIAGDRLWRRDIKQLLRNDIIESGDRISYFYSDGFLSIMDDGNGLTDRHVFSYWKEDNGVLNRVSATYEEIDSFEVTKGETLWDNTIVNVKLKSGNDFLLFLSRVDSGDDHFISELRKRLRVMD